MYRKKVQGSKNITHKKCEMHVDEQLNDGNGFLQGMKFMILARLMEL
jgi:hypothetical protein